MHGWSSQLELSKHQPSQHVLRLRPLRFSSNCLFGSVRLFIWFYKTTYIKILLSLSRTCYSRHHTTKFLQNSSNTNNARSDYGTVLLHGDQLEKDTNVHIFNADMETASNDEVIYSRSVL
jgi:hypothetical protein